MSWILNLILTFTIENKDRIKNRTQTNSPSFTTEASKYSHLGIKKVKILNLSIPLFEKPHMSEKIIYEFFILKNLIFK